MADRHVERGPGIEATARANSFSRQLRVRRSADFRKVMAEGQRTRDERLTVWMMPNGAGASRLGLIVSRKHGNAVQRNRFKRVIREAFRTTRRELPGGFDILCAPVAGVQIRLADCRESLRRLTERLAKRWTASGRS